MTDTVSVLKYTHNYIYIHRYLKGKVYILMNNGHVAVFRRFSGTDYIEYFNNYCSIYVVLYLHVHIRTCVTLQLLCKMCARW